MDMMKLFLALVLLSAYTAAQSIGYDITGTNLTVLNASSVSACAQQCDGNSKCVGWVWDGKSACALKSTITARPANANLTSDVRQGEVGYDRSGYDLPGSPYFLASPATASTCSYLCSNTTGCVAWSWTGAYCSVKWWVAGRTAAAGATAAATGITSGVVGTYGNDWPGVGDLASTVLPPNASSTACANLCESTSGCVAWSFSLLGSSCSAPNTCYLKKFVPGAVTTGQTCRTAALSSQYYNTSMAGGAAPKLASVVPLGNQSDTHLPLTHFDRDGGAVGTLGGKIVWIWADTDVTVNGTWIGIWGNSYAIGTPGNPLQMTGPIGQAIPYTKTERSFNYKNNWSPRVTLWIKSPVIETSPGHGVLWTPKDYWGNTTNTNATNSGIVLSTATIGSDGGLNITRLSDVPLWNSSYPSYSTTAAVRDQDYVYLYSSGHIPATANSFIARAPLASATVLSTYEYYYASSQTWQSTPPLVTSTADAIWQSPWGISGNMYYSSYHKLWIFVYQYNAYLDISIRFAKAPQGPFFGDQLVFRSPPPTATGVGYIYGTTGTNLYDYTGKTASTDHTWVTRGTGYKNWVNQVNFL